MKFSIPNHLRRHKLTATLLASVLFAGPAMAALDDAKAILQVLLKKGIIVRPVGNYGLPQWLRISIGLPAENAAFIAALKAVLA